MVGRIFFLVAGVAFGYVLIVSGVSNYDVIREMFLLTSFHLYGVLMVAVGIAFVVMQVLHRLKVKSLLTGQPIDMTRERPGREHVIGGLIAGAGWSLTGACPGPALAQIGFGTLAGLFTVIGIFLGVYLFGRLRSAVE